MHVQHTVFLLFYIIIIIKNFGIEQKLEPYPAYQLTRDILILFTIQGNA